MGQASSSLPSNPFEFKIGPPFSTVSMVFPGGDVQPPSRMPPKREGGPSSTAFRVALVLHAVFEAGVGLNILATPGECSASPPPPGRIWLHTGLS